MNIRKDTQRTVVIGPILDADGAAKTDEVVASVLASKNGGNPAALDGSATLTHKQTGYYLLLLTATDCNTLGCLEISLNSGTNTMPIVRFNVLTTAAWDDLHTSTVVPDAAGTAAALHATTDALIGGLTVPDAAGTAAALHATTDALIGALTVPDAAGTAAALHATTDALIGALSGADAEAIADQVFNELIAAHTTPDSFGKLLNDLTEKASSLYRFTSAALVQAPAGSSLVQILPLSATASWTGEIPYNRLTGYQHCAPGPWTIAVTDADEAAVDLSGKDLTMIFWAESDPATIDHELKNHSGQTEITVGGTENNQVTITPDDTNTATARHLRWLLVNVTDDQALAAGALEIKANPETTAVTT